ncbi:hypothetical protein BDW22DRAFT_1268384 [Trametopsis cervina]|nr:hypothetical protein BDW22DRAFT_1268384 [Trametopsis cervina]
MRWEKRMGRPWRDVRIPDPCPSTQEPNQCTPSYSSRSFLIRLPATTARPGSSPNILVLYLLLHLLPCFLLLPCLLLLLCLLSLSLSSFPYIHVARPALTPCSPHITHHTKIPQNAPVYPTTDPR